VRDSEFPADEGYQLTGTIKHESDKGDLILYARYLDDKNQFITPIPVIQTGTDNFHEFPGFDPLDSTYNGKALQHVVLNGAPEGPRRADLADGRGAQMLFLGANYDIDLDNGWSISDKFLFNTGDVDTNALFSGSNPATLFDTLYTISTDLGGLRLPLNSATANFVGGGAVPNTQEVISQGWWSILKDLEQYNNDLRVSKELFDGNTLTVGLYTAYYTMDDKWVLGNHMLMTNQPNARPITVTFVQGGQTLQRTDTQGFLDEGGFNIAEAGHAFNKALYLSDQPRVPRRQCRHRRQPADRVQQRHLTVRRDAGHHGLRRGLHLVDARCELQLHGHDGCVRARQSRRPFPGLRQRHPWRDHR
jgi:hypothetical protein